MPFAKDDLLGISRLLAYARLPSRRYVLVKLVPAHHVYLRLLQRIDFGFVRPLAAPLYSSVGRPSLSVKLLLVQHLENITSDRRLVELASLHISIRAFLGYVLSQPLQIHGRNHARQPHHLL